MHYDILVIGGGAAGFFGAIACAEANPNLRIAILEKTMQVLSKVKISGGGRCNVTHACFDERELVKSYPRGQKELLGPFTRFKTSDTIAWFNNHGIELKIEEDGRMFPITDNSSTIIDCFLKCVKNLHIDLFLHSDVQSIKKEENLFIVHTKEAIFQTNAVLMATGSNPKGHALAKSLGHTIIEPVPSLFTFNTPSSSFLDLAGISVNPVLLTIKGTSLKQRGPILLTHWGFSGPAVLKLSAWGARILHDRNYQAELIIDWLPDQRIEEVKEIFLNLKTEKPQAKVSLDELFDLPKNLSKRILQTLKIEDVRYAGLSHKQIETLVQFLKNATFQIDGKTTYKQEFVTAGGIDLKEINFKTCESLFVPNLYFAGEILNIDGITGGFNFQNAWTTSWLAAQAIQNKK